MSEEARILHWYDLACPYCYVAQARNTAFSERSVSVTQLGFRAHPEIPAGGVRAPDRSGPAYRRLEREAAVAGLPLRWPARIPNTTLALSASEWVRRAAPSSFAWLQAALFGAHFASGEDLEDPDVIEGYAALGSVNIAALRGAWRRGVALAALERAERLGLQAGVRGTPAWLVGGVLVNGLRPVDELAKIADQIGT